MNWVGVVLHDVRGPDSAPADVNVLQGGESTVCYSLGRFNHSTTTQCIAFLSATVPLPYQTVMQDDSVLSTTH